MLLTFDKDSKTVFSLLKQSLIGTPAWSWVRHLDQSQDGRKAMRALNDHYKGQDSIDKRVTLAQGVISMSGSSSVFYNDEHVFTFESYITLLRQSFTTLDICGQTVAQEAMVTRLYDGIRVQNNNAEMIFAKKSMLEKHRKDFNDAATYMSGQVAQIFPPTALNRIGKKRPYQGDSYNSYRQVSEMRGGGRFGGRGGRFGGRGGQGRDRGGRNDNHHQGG